MFKLKNILIAPLDWGLGHATRIIPLITNLLEKNCTVFIAAEGATKVLLQKEFPNLKFLPLQGYRIQYSHRSAWFAAKMVLQIPHIVIAIYREHQWLKEVARQYSIDVIISDNRFGLWHKSVKSVYITHQLLIKTGSKLGEVILQQCHYWFIKRYTVCWVPDFEDVNNFAGQLSHPTILPPKVRYVGGVSRMEKKYAGEPVFDLLVLLSGPEPQRSIFEKGLLFQLEGFSGNVLFVRGLPAEEEGTASPISRQNITIKNHLGAPELSLAMEQAAMILCRSGYTTIMDLLKLQKKAILVPTPGQTEQEYLGKYLMERKLFYTTVQQNFSLNNTLMAVANFNFTSEEYNMEQYKEVIADFLACEDN